MVSHCEINFWDILAFLVFLLVSVGVGLVAVLLLRALRFRGRLTGPATTRCPFCAWAEGSERRDVHVPPTSGWGPCPWRRISVSIGAPCPGDDARHVFETQKYGSYFVTTDARLLKRAEEIKTECGVDILRPSQFLELVHNYDRPDSR